MMGKNSAIQTSLGHINTMIKSPLTIEKTNEFYYGYINNHFVYRSELSDQGARHIGITVNPAMDVRLTK